MVSWSAHSLYSGDCLWDYYRHKGSADQRVKKKKKKNCLQFAKLMLHRTHLDHTSGKVGLKLR